MSWTVKNLRHVGGEFPRSELDIYAGRIARMACGCWMRGSPLGNPFKLERERDRPAVLAQYRSWLWDEIAKYDDVYFEVHRLALMEDGRLWCWCAPKPCHADVISRCVDWFRLTQLGPQLPMPYACYQCGQLIIDGADYAKYDADGDRCSERVHQCAGRDQ